MLSPEETQRAIESGLGDQEPTWELMCAAIEGAIMGQCYLAECKVDSRFIEINALKAFLSGLANSRLQRRPRSTA